MSEQPTNAWDAIIFIVLVFVLLVPILAMIFDDPISALIEAIAERLKK